MYRCKFYTTAVGLNTSDCGRNELIQVAEIDNPSWIESRKRVYSVNGISPILHGIGCGGNTEHKILDDTNCLIQIGILSNEKYAKMTDIYRRVYSAQGIAPTIHTCPGGNTEPKIIEDFYRLNDNTNKE